MCAASDWLCDSESKLCCFSKNGMYVQIYLITFSLRMGMFDSLQWYQSQGYSVHT